MFENGSVRIREVAKNLLWIDSTILVQVMDMNRVNARLIPKDLNRRYVLALLLLTFRLNTKGESSLFHRIRQISFSMTFFCF